MDNIKKEFDLRFANFDMTLPEDSLEKMEGGDVYKKGVSVTYAFGSDEKGRHLNVYAQSRFVWGAIHIRIYDTGDVVELPGLSDVVIYHSNATQEEIDGIKNNLRKHDDMVYEMLEKEGIKQIWDKKLDKFCEELEKDPVD